MAVQVLDRDSKMMDIRPYSGMVREVPLTDNQSDRLRLLQNNPDFVTVSDVLMNTYQSGFGIYGGTSLLIELDLPVKDVFFTPVTEDMATSDAGYKFDLTKNADIDLMVEDIGDPLSLMEDLRQKLGDNYEVTLSSPDEYPRVDIMLGGVEVMSVSDLKSSAKQVRAVNMALGLENGQGDFETYFTAKFLKNDQDPIWVDSIGAKVVAMSDRSKPTALLEMYDGSIYRPEVADVLAENEKKDLAQVVMREWVYSISKLAVLKQFTGFEMYPEDAVRVRKLVDDNADFVRSDAELRRITSRRLAKAINGNFTWFAHAASTYGVLGWFSGSLQKEVDVVMSDQLKFRKLINATIKADNQMFSNKIMGVDDFVELVLQASGTEDGEKIKTEFFENWNPGDMSGVAFQGGRRVG
jgi:hypothetical protein